MVVVVVERDRRAYLSGETHADVLRVGVAVIAAAA
jgi:hypothetical protein